MESIERRWALALGALYIIINNEGHDPVESMTFDSLIPKGWAYSAASARNILNEAWGIGGILQSKKRSSARQTLRWLAFEGHRAPYQHEIDFLQGSELNHIAWDLVRLVLVTQNCVLAGYIEEQEGWHFVATAGLQAQPAFTAWGELGACFSLGRQHWNNQPAEDAFERVIQWLTSNPRSPWQQLSWNLNLQSLGRDIDTEMSPNSLSDSLVPLFQSLGFSRLQPFSFYRRRSDGAPVERINVSVHVRKDGDLDLSVSAGVRFEEIEKLLWPHRGPTSTALTLGQYLSHLAPSNSITTWRIGTIADAIQSQKEIERSIIDHVMPYLDQLGSLERVQKVLLQPGKETCCAWSPEIRRLMSVCMDAIRGHRSGVQEQLGPLLSDPEWQGFAQAVAGRIEALP